MTKTTILLFIVSLFYVSVWADDCDNPQPTPVPTGGFKLRAFSEVFNPNDLAHPTIKPDAGRGILAGFQSDKPGAAGNNRGPVSGTTDQFGDLNIVDGRAPATWRFRETDGICAGLSIDLVVQKGKQTTIYCVLSPRIVGAFTSTPDAVEAESTPQPITVTGEDFSTSYGMPLIRYFDENGVLVAEAYADQVAPDGTWLTGSTTDLSSVYTGQYTVMIYNAAADGTMQTLGGTTLEVFHYVEPPPDPDPCGGCGGGGNQCVEMPCYIY